RDADWYKQLTAEKLVTRYVKGQPVREWTKPDKARNEGLDCRVYALAALKIMNPSFKRLAERYAIQATKGADGTWTTEPATKPQPKPQPKPAPENPQEEQAPPAVQTKPIIKRSKAAAAAKRGGRGWVTGW